jgi:hypothetical protein
VPIRYHLDEHSCRHRVLAPEATQRRTSRSRPDPALESRNGRRDAGPSGIPLTDPGARRSWLVWFSPARCFSAAAATRSTGAVHSPRELGQRLRGPPAARVAAGRWVTASRGPPACRRGPDSGRATLISFRAVPKTHQNGATGGRTPSGGRRINAGMTQGAHDIGVRRAKPHQDCMVSPELIDWEGIASDSCARRAPSASLGASFQRDSNISRSRIGEDRILSLASEDERSTSVKRP